jgi:manganese/iron transport system permease protein
MVTFFDETHARSIGLNTTALKIMFFTLLSASTVAACSVGASSSSAWWPHLARPPIS